ncbi:Eco57I restriction-modification methylase domain-containing protein [Leptospira kmetyi]|uniref:Eco57I restriction-modification methylase domain-containing protein n=1 Tax=Leptospira kmetyi TaxID=408139 RepID=UPI003EBE5F99
MTLKNEIEKLVGDFERENSKANSEEHIQSLYTLKLLELLGYKSNNFTINQGQDVKTGKKPDILIKNDSGNTLIVIESKEASKSNILDGSYGKKTFVDQLFGYCKAEGVFWGIITNFVEWRIYSVYQNRIYKDAKYAFRKLLWENVKDKNYIDLLSSEGLEFLDRLCKENLTKNNGRWDNDPVYYPKQEEIKEKFFKDLKNWRANLRDYLTKNYKSKYDLETIDLMTQKTLDRLIFIDYCSDNQIIPQSRLRASLESKGHLYKELKNIFQDMDEKFNSELFSFSECDLIDISDEIIKPIISDLSNTDFSKLSVHVIGEVYENYLGELLKAGKGGVRVLDEEANLKQKTQGIYYTPDYIVDYIVRNTVGEILKKCKTIQEIENIRVLDPACGSGSFLIRVFEEFLKHYERIQKYGMFQFEVRKKILQKNIYGIDLDARAVEITKLNLMVKALEGSSYVDLVGRKLLPNLKLNIRCGNSLISGEEFDKKEDSTFWQFHEKDLRDLNSLRDSFYKSIDDHEKNSAFEKIQVLEYMIDSKLNQNLNQYFKRPDEEKPLNYSTAFPEVLSKGGFDCIVGNPPYIPIEFMTKNQKDFYTKQYIQLEGKFDSSVIFIISQIEKLNSHGLLGYISSVSWQTGENFSQLREYLFNKFSLTSLVNLPYDIFKNAYVDTGIYVISKNHSNNYNIFNFPKKSIIHSLEGIKFQKISTKLIRPPEFKIVLDIVASNITQRLNKNLKFTTLGELTYSTQGLAGNKFNLAPRISKTSYPYLEKGQVYRYAFLIESKSNTDMSDKENLRIFYESTPKILIRRIINRQDRIMCAYTEEKIVFKKDINPFILNSQEKEETLFVLGILNSRLISYLYINRSSIATKNDFRQTTLAELRNLRIPEIKQAKETVCYRSISALVKEITDLNSELFIVKSETEKERLAVKLGALDKQIDKLVYEIYALSSEEIEVIDKYFDSFGN